MHSGGDGETGGLPVDDTAGAGCFGAIKHDTEIIAVLLSRDLLPPVEDEGAGDSGAERGEVPVGQISRRESIFAILGLDAWSRAPEGGAGGAPLQRGHVQSWAHVGDRGDVDGLRGGGAEGVFHLGDVKPGVLGGGGPCFKDGAGTDLFAVLLPGVAEVGTCGLDLQSKGGACFHERRIGCAGDKGHSLDADESVTRGGGAGAVGHLAMIDTNIGDGHGGDVVAAVGGVRDGQPVVPPLIGELGP